MKKLLLPFLFFYVFISFAQNKPVNPSVLKEDVPESLGFSSERLKRIDNVLQEYVDKQYFAGAVAIISRNGRIVYHKAIGYNDIDTKTPLKKDAIFRIASQTKAITSVAVMMLFEEGNFLLDDPVSKYIPEYKNLLVVDKFNLSDTTYTTVKAKRAITIRDLLTHTSGIGYAQIGDKTMNALYSKFGIISGIGAEKIKLEEQMKKLGSVPLLHQPGDKFTYGLNCDLLGYLVEVVSGMSLDEFFRKRIFEPLGMNDTYFYIPKEKQNRLTIIYTEDSTKKLIKAKDKNRDYPNTDGIYYSGGAGLSSTVYDYSIFMQMLLNGGTYNGKQILSRNSIRMMTMNQIGDLSSGGGNKFGLGFGVVTAVGSAKLPVTEGSYWWGGIFGSAYWIDPNENLTAQIFIQKYPNSYSLIQDKFKVLVYQALK
jgi:CubicO group peptidase (beta-lactamase class C family)